MEPIADCPDRDLLERYLLGLVPAGERPSLEKHLARCAQCVALLLTLRPTDPLLDTLQAIGLDASTIQDPAVVRDLVRRVETLFTSSGDSFDPARHLTADGEAATV